MNITVRYCAQIKQASGMAVEHVEVPSGCTAQDLVRLMAEKHGEPLRGFLLNDAGEHRTNNLLIVGEEQVPWSAARPLRDGDALTILPPISGGAP